MNSESVALLKSPCANWVVLCAFSIRLPKALVFPSKLSGPINGSLLFWAGTFGPSLPPPCDQDGMGAGCQMGNGRLRNGRCSQRSHEAQPAQRLRLKAGEHVEFMATFESLDGSVTGSFGFMLVLLLIIFSYRGSYIIPQTASADGVLNSCKETDFVPT